MSTTPSQTPLGRESELLAVHELIERARTGHSGSLAMIGSAGTGKTTILGEVERLAAGGADPLTVLRAHGIESETEVPFGGLLELLRPVADLIPRLPAPQAPRSRERWRLRPRKKPTASLCPQRRSPFLASRLPTGPFWSSSTTSTGSTRLPPRRFCSPPADSGGRGSQSCSRLALSPMRPPCSRASRSSRWDRYLWTRPRFSHVRLQAGISTKGKWRP